MVLRVKDVGLRAYNVGFSVQGFRAQGVGGLWMHGFMACNLQSRVCLCGLWSLVFSL